MIGFQWLLGAGHELSTGTVEGVDDSATVGQRGMAAAGKMLTAILSHAADQSGLKADWPRIAAS